MENTRMMVTLPLDEYTNLIRENQMLRCQHEMEELRRQIDELTDENVRLFAQTLHPQLTIEEALADEA